MGGVGGAREEGDGTGEVATGVQGWETTTSQLGPWVSHQKKEYSSNKPWCRLWGKRWHLTREERGFTRAKVGSPVGN